MSIRLHQFRWLPIVAAIAVASGVGTRAAGDKPPADDDPAPVEAELEAAVDVQVLEAGVGVGFMPMPAEGAPADDEEARLAPFRQQFLPLVRRELTFANRVCDWTDEDRQEAVAAGRTWLEAFIRTQVANQAQVQQGVMIFMNAGGRLGGVRPDRASTPDEELAASIRATMSAEQQAKYDDELKLRRASRKQAVIDNLVAQLDERMNLTPQQREKIARSLHVRWDESWAPPLEVFVQMAEYFPAVPDEAISPHLSPEQKTLWAGLQKVSFAGGVNFGQGLFPADVGFDEFDLEPAE